MHQARIVSSGAPSRSKGKSWSICLIHLYSNSVAVSSSTFENSAAISCTCSCERKHCHQAQTVSKSLSLSLSAATAKKTPISRNDFAAESQICPSCRPSNHPPRGHARFSARQQHRDYNHSGQCPFSSCSWSSASYVARVYVKTAIVRAFLVGRLYMTPAGPISLFALMVASSHDSTRCRKQTFRGQNGLSWKSELGPPAPDGFFCSLGHGHVRVPYVSEAIMQQVEQGKLTDEIETKYGVGKHQWDVPLSHLTPSFIHVGARSPANEDFFADPNPFQPDLDRRRHSL